VSLGLNNKDLVEFEGEEDCIKEMRSAESSGGLQRLSELLGRCLERSGPRDCSGTCLYCTRVQV
jgi:wyosine [tRNA(Phe)-imidazoG37] synthetase (radical SAM superfamily)